MTSCERCWSEAQKRGIEYRDMLRIADAEEHPCITNTLEGARLRAGQFWDDATKTDTRTPAKAAVESPAPSKEPAR
jgi:hypothetical protein